MAKTKQEKEDAKREREYEKKHKRKYRLTPGDIVFYIFNYLFFTLFTITCICYSYSYLLYRWFHQYIHERVWNVSTECTG